MPLKWPFNQDTAPYLLEMNLHTPKQLFNTFDPSPFHEKDLDPAAERYIVDAVDMLSLAHPVCLVIHLPEDAIYQDSATQFQTSISNFFSYRATATLNNLRRCFRECRIAWLVGLIFLISCSLIREVVLTYGEGFSHEMFAEGLLIIGWVALWRPADMLLYEWWPILRRYRLLLKISQLTVEVKPSEQRHFGA